MRIISLIILLVVTAAAVSFVASNTEPMTLGFWPFVSTLTGPVFLVAMAPFAVGFLAGAVIAWDSQREARENARMRGRRVAYLESELDAAQTRAEKAEQALAERDSGVQPARSGVLLPPARRYGALNLAASEPGVPPMVGAASPPPARGR